jgi:NADPH:quinone reductase-like Zn-dependent oxidoreductase
MKAVINTQYGSADVLQVRDVDRPTPGDNEVLVRVRAASVTPSDIAFRKADPFIIRLMYGLRKPRLSIPGVELAGEVEVVGREVTEFQPGDNVYGMSSTRFGAHAEYVCLPADGVLAAKPQNAGFIEAVGICDGAMTALVFLRDKARLRPGQNILVNGASGAVGCYAIQLAQHYGAEVTGVCSSANFELVRSLGAGHVIDYTRADFTRDGETYDVIFDAVGKRSFSQCARALREGGVYMTTVPSAGIFVQMARTAVLGHKRAVFAATGLSQSRANLEYLTGLMETGAIRPVIDRCYPLEEIAEAHRYVETSRKRGNVVVVVNGVKG